MDVMQELDSLADPEKAKVLQRFFKTGLGQYGEGDVFLGIKMPLQRDVARKYKEIPFAEVQELLDSKTHEYRMTGLIILTLKFRKQPKETFEFYVKNTKAINNWDLVDVTCPNIVGEYLKDKEKDLLYKWAESENLWERRMAMLACYAFIKKSEYEDALKIAEILLNDKHDLIHKAVGWMLREIGNRDQETEERFLRKHYKTMPRTMLRYAIEKFSKEKREFYLGRT